MRCVFKIACIVIISLRVSFCYSQATYSLDTIPVRILDSVTVSGYLLSGRSYLPETEGTYLRHGKKSELISLSNANADIANKVGRQIFAKVAGIFVYDMDGSGNQVNIATRGLDPHRGWDFNIRKDDVITNSDMYGYPASHYSMPLESIERIELVRGTGSLQYGAQFGGMLNYITKKADSTRPFSYESINSLGSYNLLSTYHAIGGRIGKITYYAYINRKSKDGYRKNEHTNSEAQALVITYTPVRQMTVRLEWARSAYTYRIPGPLTDAMFQADPRQATRARNYFRPSIHIPSLTVTWEPGSNTKIQLLSSAVLGDRSSVMFDKPANISDTVNTATLQYNSRQVDVDRFNSYTSELRVLHNYSWGKLVHTFVGGVQYINNDLHRTQLGKGTTGSDFDLSLVDPVWGRDVHFKTGNLALFTENKWQLNNKLALTAGTRIEMGKSAMSGTINYYPENKIPITIRRQFPLFGLGFVYATAKKIQFYGGWSTAYHPMVFKDLIPASLYEKVDPNISDATGSNAEFGFRGNWKILKWDITTFLLQQNNRFGSLAQIDNTSTFYTYRTNVGHSLSKGLEVFIEADIDLGKNGHVLLFTSTAFMRARYTKGLLKSGTNNIDIAGNRVESAPDLTSRNGITWQVRKIKISALHSYTSSTFADALNTVNPSVATGAVGLVPAYALFDINSAIQFSKTFELRLNISNVFNRQYFTKRPLFYPGPGVWPSEGRNFTASVAVRI